MESRRIVLYGHTRKKLRRVARKTRDADARTRYLLLRAADGWSGRRIGKALGCCPATVSRTLDRWEGYGEAGLVDPREDNGRAKADGLFAETVLWVLESSLREFFHRRPTWTRRLLVETAATYTGVAVSATTMGRLLKRLKVRRGRAKPTAPGPWSEAARKRRVAMIHALIDALPADQAWREGEALLRGRTRPTSTSTPASGSTRRCRGRSGW